MPQTDLIDDLDQRRSRWEAGDPGGVLSAEALAVAERLWHEARECDPAHLVDAAVAILALHWCRAHQETAGRPHDIAVVISLGMVLGRFDADRVPAEMHMMLGGVHDDRTLTALRGIDDPADLAYAAHLGRALAGSMPDDDARLGGILECLVIMLEARFAAEPADGALQDLIHATRRLRDRAVGPSYLSNTVDVAGWLRLRYERTGATEALEESVQLLREVAAQAQDDPSAYANLCYLLGLRFQENGDVTDLDEAVASGRQALAMAGDQGPQVSVLLGNLCQALRQRYQRQGDLADLHEAVALGRRGAEKAQDDGMRAMVLNGLGLALRARHRRLHAFQDIDDAVATGRGAVAAAGERHPDRGSYLSNLALALRVRFDLSHQLVDLDEAIVAASHAVEALPPGHHNAKRTLNNLSLCHRARFDATGRIEDLEQAVAIARRLLDSTSRDHPQWAEHANNLGLALESRFAAGGVLDDLNQAVDSFREAVEVTPSGALDAGGRLNNLARTLQKRFRLDGDVADLRAAMTAWEAIVGQRLSQTGIRLLAAVSLAEVTARTTGLPAAVAAYRTAVELLATVPWLGLARADQERQLAGGPTRVAVDAARAPAPVARPGRRVNCWSRVVPCCGPSSCTSGPISADYPRTWPAGSNAAGTRSAPPPPARQTQRRNRDEHGCARERSGICPARPARRQGGSHQGRPRAARQREVALTTRLIIPGCNRAPRSRTSSSSASSVPISSRVRIAALATTMSRAP